MKTKELMIAAAAAAAAAVGLYWFHRRKGATAVPPPSLAGTQLNSNLSGPFNLGGNLLYDFTPTQRADLNSQGQGSGFFSKPLQLSVMP